MHYYRPQYKGPRSTYRKSPDLKLQLLLLDRCAGRGEINMLTRSALGYSSWAPSCARGGGHGVYGLAVPRNTSWKHVLVDSRGGCIHVAAFGLGGRARPAWEAPGVNFIRRMMV